MEEVRVFSKRAKDLHGKVEFVNLLLHGGLARLSHQYLIKLPPQWTYSQPSLILQVFSFNFLFTSF